MEKRGRTLPVAQASQSVAPKPEKERPTGHCLQFGEPRTSAYSPDYTHKIEGEDIDEDAVLSVDPASVPDSRCRRRSLAGWSCPWGSRGSPPRPPSNS